MDFFNIFSNYSADIVSLFIAFIVSYYTVQRINDKDEFLEDNTREVKNLKLLWGTISFLGTFLILVFLASIFYS